MPLMQRGVLDGLGEISTSSKSTQSYCHDLWRLFSGAQNGPIIGNTNKFDIDPGAPVYGPMPIVYRMKLSQQLKATMGPAGDETTASEKRDCSSLILILPDSDNTAECWSAQDETLFTASIWIPTKAQEEVRCTVRHMNKALPKTAIPR
jgi:hypothetical protein